MPAFCTKCGSALPSSTKFCATCGAPVSQDPDGVAAGQAVPPVPPVMPVQPVTPVVAAVPIAYAAPPAQAGAGYGQPPAGYPMAPQKSTSALKIILIVVLVLVAIGVVGTGVIGYMGWRVAKSVHVDQDGKNVSITSPMGGNVQIGDSTATDADLGVPAYPGAKREQGGMNLNSGSASMVMAHFSTSDSQTQVTDYYKGKMGDAATVVSSGEGTVITAGSKDTDSTVVTVAPGSGDDAGKTTILVMHTQKKGGA